VMSYVLDELKKLGNVEEIVYITGHLKEKVEEFARAEMDVPSVFIEQKVQDGTAGAIALARDYVDQPVLIIFVDTIFDADLSKVKSVDADGIIWVKEVEDYQRFGVVVTDADGNMTQIIEKPKTPVSKRANIGLYYIRNWKLLFEGIEWVLKQPKNQGEYFLTDAFQYMIEKGAKIKVIDVEGWYDAGKIETMIETNEAMLKRGRARRPKSVGDSTIIDPVYIEDNVTLKKSKIGPNVSIGAGSVLDGASISHSIVGANAKITKSVLKNSLVGDDTVVEGVNGEVTLGDNSEVRTS
jgi:glucose-1-phosphate thymidylyltransferase